MRKKQHERVSCSSWKGVLAEALSGRRSRACAKSNESFLRVPGTCPPMARQLRSLGTVRYGVPDLPNKEEPMKSDRFICLFAFLSILSPGCGDNTDLDVEARSSGSAQEGNPSLTENRSMDSTALSSDGPESLSGCGNCDNCVLHARCLTGGRLPYGLDSWAAKKSIVTSNRPRAGCVAVMDTRIRATDPGHVAYVTSASADGSTISVAEANFPANVCRTWRGSAASRKVVGYWCP